MACFSRLELNFDASCCLLPTDISTVKSNGSEQHRQPTMLFIGRGVQGERSGAVVQCAHIPDRVMDMRRAVRSTDLLVHPGDCSAAARFSHFRQYRIRYSAGSTVGIAEGG